MLLWKTNPENLAALLYLTNYRSGDMSAICERELLLDRVQHKDPRSLWIYLGFLQNLSHSGEPMNPLPSATWSLAIEEQFIWYGHFGMLYRKAQTILDIVASAYWLSPREMQCDPSWYRSFCDI